MIAFGAALLSACSAARERIVVDRPLVVGFFPAVSQAELERKDELASANEHFAIALDHVSACLRSRGIAVDAVYADEIVFDDAGRQTTVGASAQSPDGIGCALVAPGRTARVVRAAAGASSLVLYCPAAAAIYFDAPQCCPDGWRCCADDRIVDATVDCPAAQ